MLLPLGEANPAWRPSLDKHLLSSSNLFGTPSLNKHPSRDKRPLSFHFDQHSTIRILLEDNHIMMVIFGRLKRLKLLSIILLDRTLISDLHEAAWSLCLDESMAA